MENEVSLQAPPETPDNEVSIAAPQQNPSLPDKVATARAAKIQAAVGNNIPMKSVDEIKQEIQAGHENIIRQMAASNLEAQRQENQLRVLSNLAAQSDQPLRETDINRILDPFNPANTPHSPDSVVEKNYGQDYISSIPDAIQAKESDLSQAPPENAQRAYDLGSELVARQEGYRKLREDAEAVLHQQSWGGYLADTAKNMFQPYIEYKMRGLDTGAISGGILLGTNLQSSADAVYGLPLTESLQKAKAIGDYLQKDNPQLAVKWYEYLEGIPTTDKVLDNAFTALMPLDYAGMAKGGLNAIKRIDLAVRTNTAVRQMVEVADRVGTNTAGRAEAAGDLGTAAEVRSTDNILQSMNGQRNPIDAVTEPLLTSLNQDAEKIGTAPGNLSTEGVRRIQDQYAASGTGFVQRLIDAVRVNRTPMALATRQAIGVLKNAVLDYYPGIRNAILDVSDPLYEPRSNTYWHEVTFGNFDGTLFSNPETAQNFAKLHNWDDIKVVQGQGVITNAGTQKLLNQKATLERQLADANEGLQANKAKLTDDKISDADRAYAQDQVKGFTEHQKNFQAKLDEVNLRLTSGAAYDRVSGLQKEVDSLTAANKVIKAQLKDKVKYVEGMDARNDLIKTQKANADTIKAHTAEIKAIKEGNASVIGGSTTVQQHGVGYKIVLRRPLVETDRAVRDLLIRDANGNIIPDAVSTSSSTGFKSLFNAALWRFRGADDTLAINESIQRKIGTYTQSLFKQWASDEAKYLRQISTGVIRNDPVTGAPIPYWKAKPVAIWNKFTGANKEMHDRFIRTLEFARDARDDAGNVGYFFRTPGELNDHYLRYFNQSPSFAEHQAYFAFTRMVEGDRMLREVAEFRNRARLGVEQWQLSARNKLATESSQWFDGRKLKKFPGGDDVMMIMGRRKGDERLVNLGGAGLSPRDLEKAREDVETGRKTVIEVYAPEHTPLRDFSDVAGNEHVRYVLVDSAKSKPIEFNHVNRRGGGHFEYDYDHFLKQAKMYHQYENLQGVRNAFKSVYHGDTTVMPLLNRKMGEDIAKHFTEVQRLIKSGDLDAARAYTEAHLPIEWNDMHGYFKPGRDDVGRPTPPLLDLNEKFVVVPKGRTVLDMDPDLAKKYGTTFKNAATSGSLNRQFNVAYNTERESEGIRHFMDTGTAGNPVYKYSPTTKFVDPITTMNKALNRIVTTTFMDDYKMYAVEHWLREAEPHLEPTRANLVNSSPYWVFTSSLDKSAFRAGTPWETMRNLLSNRWKILQFTGIPSQFDTAIHSAKQMLADWSYAKFGPEEGRGLAAKSVTLVPNWMLSHVHDPVTFLRSMTFHEKLGLFNPAQLLVQAQSYATILSISPRAGGAGAYAALLHSWSRLNRNPEIIRALDNYATKLNMFGSRWKPGEFQEAMETYERTGLGNVAGEYANLNTALKTDFVGNDFKSFLNAGTIFFRLGERSIRDGAWYTAFREFRDVNPTRTLTRDDIGKILQRADLLTANMSRASNSILQSGILSLPSQFLTYQVRLAELFLGSRLGATTSERMMARARILSFYALLYGAPSAIGVTGLPIADNIRKEAIQRGYVIGDNWIKTAVMEGLPSIMLAMITGEGNTQKGNNYNIGPRYGVGGFTQFTDAMRSDHPWWQLLGGASGSSFLDTFNAAASPFWRVMSSQLQDDNNKKAYPLVIQDLIEPFKNISSVNQTWKLIAAIETGKWMSKNEVPVDHVSVANATFMALTGLSPQEQSDAYLKGNLVNSQQEMQKWAAREAKKELRRMYEAQANGDHNDAAAFAKRADAIMTISGMPMDRRASVYAQSLRGRESMIQDQDWRFASQNVPTSRSDFLGIPMPFTTQSNIEQTRLDQFRRQSQLNNLRNPQ